MRLTQIVALLAGAALLAYFFFFRDRGIAQITPSVNTGANRVGGADRDALLSQNQTRQPNPFLPSQRQADNQQNQLEAAGWRIGGQLVSQGANAILGYFTGNGNSGASPSIDTPAYNYDSGGYDYVPPDDFGGDLYDAPAGFTDGGAVYAATAPKPGGRIRTQPARTKPVTAHGAYTARGDKPLTAWAFSHPSAVRVNNEPRLKQPRKTRVKMVKA